MPDLIETIHQIIDNNDPTQKAIGLLAMLVDNKFKNLDTKMEKVERQLHEQDIALEEHRTRCPLNMPEKLAELQKQVEPFTFIIKYPKLAVLMLIGLLALMGLGIDKLISFF